MLELDIERIAGLLTDRNCASADRLHWFDRIGSTNDHIMALGDFHGAVCLAGEQTAGRGRRGRAWDSRRGAGIYLSMGWRLDGVSPAGLSLLCGMTVLRALEDAGVTGVGLKWPNDVLLEGAKLAGILVELNGDRCVIGIGLNVTLHRSPGVPGEVPGGNALPRTSLAAHGYHIDAESFTASLISLLHRDLAGFCRSGFAAHVEKYNAVHAFHGKTVEIVSGKIVTGRVVGVDGRGGLCLENGGQWRTFHAGEVSMKPGNHGR